MNLALLSNSSSVVACRKKIIFKGEWQIKDDDDSEYEASKGGTIMI